MCGPTALLLITCSLTHTEHRMGVQKIARFFTIFVSNSSQVLVCTYVLCMLKVIMTGGPKHCSHIFNIQHSYLSWLICNYVIPVKSWNEAITWQVVWTYWTRDMWVPASQKYKLLQTLPMELYKFKSWKFDLCWNDKNSTLTYLLSLSSKNVIL